MVSKSRFPHLYYYRGDLQVMQANPFAQTGIMQSLVRWLHSNHSKSLSYHYLLSIRSAQQSPRVGMRAT